MFNTSTYYNYGVREYWELTVQISSPGQTYALNIQGTSPSINITWGDGTSNYVTTTGNVSRTYAAAGDYKVKVSGSFAADGNIQQATGANRVIGTSRMRGLSGITSMAGTFYGCTSLTSIPSDLFIDHPNVTSFDGTFAASGLQNIPADLFNDHPFVTSFYGTFEQCFNITNIPSVLFNNNALVDSFTSTFAFCTSFTSIPANLFVFNFSVTNFSGAFTECSLITSIPPGLFDNNYLAYSFISTFANCTGLTSIPVGLFNNNTSATIFYATFAGCTNLASIPVGLFNNNINATDFQVTFTSCNKLTLNAFIFSTTGNTNRFLNQSVDFTNCFSIGTFTGVQGTAPNLWTYNFGTGTSIKTDCWQGHSAASLTNYASIPAPWL